MSGKRFAAVDLGASSGRVIAAHLDGDRIELAEAARFPNRSVDVRGRLYWDVLGLWSGVLDGLRAVGDAVSVGVDSWAVDYGLVDADGHLVGNPVSYRDGRNAAARERVLGAADPAAWFARTGIQHQPFNTAFQLAAEDRRTLDRADRALLIPDLLGYWLSGVKACEATNASTTGLVDQATGDWDPGLLDTVGVRPGLLGAITPPGTVLGPVLPEIAARTGLGPETRVVAVASHDTASAVAAVPAEKDGFAYISCGTWSLVGVEREAPVLTEEARLSGFTNEAGVDGTVRFLRNVAGLWLLSESLRTWEAEGLDIDLADLLERAGRFERLRSVVDPDDARFAEPGNMPERIRAYCAETGQPVPEDPVAVAACVVDSLALAHRRAVLALETLTGEPVATVHMVGGGTRNALLCQATADATGLPVLAGPVEATALGNALVQAQALGLIAAGPESRRAAARASTRSRLYSPQGPQGVWERAAARLHDLPIRAA
ncbi:rhamnulokinase family protein [Glycomyces sp. NPDC048151]|uniref:rhamnulokinase n=1 Tax=Glycomyces sp. NPDC048151 TaxID=3364002 RepID=UPI003723DA73